MAPPPGDRDTLVYRQPDATPASFTILNFEVDDIDETVDVALEAHASPAQRDPVRRRASVLTRGP